MENHLDKLHCLRLHRSLNPTKMSFVKWNQRKRAWRPGLGESLASTRATAPKNVHKELLRHQDHVHAIRGGARRLRLAYRVHDAWGYACVRVCQLSQSISSRVQWLARSIYFFQSVAVTYRWLAQSRSSMDKSANQTSTTDGHINVASFRQNEPVGFGTNSAAFTGLSSGEAVDPTGFTRESTSSKVKGNQPWPASVCTDGHAQSKDSTSKQHGLIRKLLCRNSSASDSRSRLKVIEVRSHRRANQLGSGSASTDKKVMGNVHQVSQSGCFAIFT